MKDRSKAKPGPIEEILRLKQRIKELEQSESERLRIAEELRVSEETYRVLFQGINDAVFVHDIDEEGRPGRFLEVNDVACRRLGYTREELLSLMPRDITLPEEYERIADKRIGLTSQGDILAETFHVTKGGVRIPVESNIRRFQYLGRQAALSISRDITERKEAEEKLKHLSIHDSLTGLHNRFLFEEELRRLGTGRFDPVGIVMCDLDGLKLVNDNLGHAVGDRQLVTTANLLKEQFRSSDIVARIGGDEFAVLLPDCPVETIQEICSRLKQAMINKHIPGTEIPLTVSIGYAVRNTKECPIEELLKEADVNMYREKTENRRAFRDDFHRIIPQTP